MVKKTYTPEQAILFMKNLIQDSYLEVFSGCKMFGIRQGSFLLGLEQHAETNIPNF